MGCLLLKGIFSLIFKVSTILLKKILFFIFLTAYLPLVNETPQFPLLLQKHKETAFVSQLQCFNSDFQLCAISFCNGFCLIFFFFVVDLRSAATFTCQPFHQQTFLMQSFSLTRMCFSVSCGTLGFVIYFVFLFFYIFNFH